MNRELEIVSHEQFSCLNILTVQLLSRTLHVHQELELGLILRGNVAVSIGHEQWKIEEGELYLINPMSAHAFHSDGGAVILAFQISLSMLEGFLPDAGQLRYAGSPPLREAFSDRPDCYAQLKELCCSLGSCYYRRHDGYELECFRLTAELLSMLYQKLPHVMMRGEEYFPLKHRTERMIAMTDYIDENYTRKLLLEEIAEREQLTMPYLSHMFREVLGVSFQEYLREKRFSEACMLLLTTNHTVLEVSLESGFSDVRYMNHLFQTRFRMSPREYRSSMRAEAESFRKYAGTEQEFLTAQEVLLLLEA